MSRQVVAQLELRKARADLTQTTAASEATEAALRASEAFKTRLIESSQDCIKVLDLDGRPLSVNAGGMRTLEVCDNTIHTDSKVWLYAGVKPGKHTLRLELVHSNHTPLKNRVVKTINFTMTEK
ncbi:MAG: hypothetical protein ACREKK_01640 [Candidatus Methylomirabilales bacterium]